MLHEDAGNIKWGDFDKFKSLSKYLPDYDEGNTMASQIATALSKLVHKWFNDGDVPDNTHTVLEGWANDLSSYANWLQTYVPEFSFFFGEYEDTRKDDDYTEILYTLCEKANDALLEKYSTKDKVGSVYTCDGPFVFSEKSDEDEDDYEENEDDDTDSLNESNVLAMPAKRQKNLDTLYDLINGDIDEDDIEHDPDDDVDEDYLNLINKAVDTGLALKLSKLYLTNDKGKALQMAKDFISTEMPELDEDTLDTYSTQMVNDYRDFAWE
jgi:hypothetical protein